MSASAIDAEIAKARKAAVTAESAGRVEERNHAVAVLEGLLKARRIQGLPEEAACAHLVHDPFEMVDGKTVWRCRECGTRAP